MGLNIHGDTPGAPQHIHTHTSSDDYTRRHGGSATHASHQRTHLLDGAVHKAESTAFENLSKPESAAFENLSMRALQTHQTPVNTFGECYSQSPAPGCESPRTRLLFKPLSKVIAIEIFRTRQRHEMLPNMFHSHWRQR